MRLLGIMLRRHRRQLSKQKMRFHWLGRSDGLPERDVQTLREMEEETRHWNDFHLSLAINYGGRDDTLRAVQKLQMKADTIDANTLQWSDIAAHMDTAHLPDVDLLIRTGGERRLSNFLLLQCAYAEMYFTDCLWPDFDAKELQIALNAYSLRHRRYGTIDRPE
jgi:undecaprenyl diphosphate synthase